MASLFDLPAASADKPSTAATARLPPAPVRLYRICMIMNDPHTDEFAAEYDLYLNWLNASLPVDSNVKFKLDPYWSQDQTYPTRDELDHYDAVVLSGSMSDASGDDDWVSLLVLFVQKVANEYPKIRIFGICFGSQIVARALGGTVVRNPKGWEIGVTGIQTTYMGKLLFGVEKLNLLLFHQDVVVLESLSDYFITGDLYLLGSSFNTACQGLVKFYPYWEQKDGSADELVNRVHIMTTQAHPEYTEEFLTMVLSKRHSDGKVDDAGHQQYFGAKGHLTNTEPVIKQDTGKRWIKHYDGIRVVGRTFWRMLGVSYGNEHPPKVPA